MFSNWFRSLWTRGVPLLKLQVENRKDTGRNTLDDLHFPKSNEMVAEFCLETVAALIVNLANSVVLIMMEVLVKNGLNPDKIAGVTDIVRVNKGVYDTTVANIEKSTSNSLMVTLVPRSFLFSAGCRSCSLCSILISVISERRSTTLSLPLLLARNEAASGCPLLRTHAAVFAEFGCRGAEGDLFVSPFITELSCHAEGQEDGRSPGVLGAVAQRTRLPLD